MESMENNDEVIGQPRENFTDPDKPALLDPVSANAKDVFEASSFQDITGQRISKVLPAANPP